MQMDGSKMFNVIIALIMELLELINKAAYEVRINLASGYLESNNLSITCEKVFGMYCYGFYGSVVKKSY